MNSYEELRTSDELAGVSADAPSRPHREAAQGLAKESDSILGPGLTVPNSR